MFYILFIYMLLTTKKGFLKAKNYFLSWIQIEKMPVVILDNKSGGNQVNVRKFISELSENANLERVKQMGLCNTGSKGFWRHMFELEDTAWAFLAAEIESKVMLNWFFFPNKYSHQIIFHHSVFK